MMTPKHSRCPHTRTPCLGAILALMALATPPTVSVAATFAPITGALNIRAGDKLPQSTVPVIGSASLIDSSFPVGHASASLQAEIVGANRFNFAAAASSSTNQAAPVGGSNATAAVGFNQTFTIAAPQWVQVTGKVLGPPGDAGVYAIIAFGPTGQPPPYTLPHTADREVTHENLFPAGGYTLTGQVHTTAVVPPAHAGAVSGFVLIAAVADFNGNLKVDGPDLAAWRSGFGSTTGTFASGNLDGDSDADGADFLLWQRQLGAMLPTAVHSIPEPGGGLLATFAVAAYCLTCRWAARRAARSPAR
jgi:hypothetical protein